MDRKKMNKKEKKDLRSRSRVPFGYEIVGGKACVNSEEAAQLRLYFRRYLQGESMKEAAKAAQLPHSQPSLPHLFKRKEYIGTDFYPAIISEEYQQELIAEREKRKKTRSKHPEMCVRVYKDFRLVRIRRYDSGDPVDSAAAFYQQIRPNTLPAKIEHPVKQGKKGAKQCQYK